MLIEAGTELGNNTILKDINGIQIDFVKSFNTETKEAELWNVQNGRIVKDDKMPELYKETIKGAKAHNKRTGKEIK